MFVTVIIYHRQKVRKFVFYGCFFTNKLKHSILFGKIVIPCDFFSELMRREMYLRNNCKNSIHFFIRKSVFASFSVKFYIFFVKFAFFFFLDFFFRERRKCFFYRKSLNPYLQISLLCEILTYIELFTVSPELFKLIEASCFLIEYMHDNIGIIKNYPCVAGIRFTSLRFDSEL